MSAVTHWSIRVNNEVNFMNLSSNQYVIYGHLNYTKSFVEKYNGNDIILFTETKKPYYLVGIARIIYS
jgi:hypothetical protein